MREQLNYSNNTTWDLCKTIAYYCLPVILLQWLGVLTSTYSTRFLSQYHQAPALAASGLTYRAFLIVLLCLNGLQFAQGVIVAKSENKEEVIPQLTSLILLIGCILAATMLTMPTVLGWFYHSTQLIHLTIPYFHWLALACPFIAFNGLWQQCFLVYKKPLWIVAIAILYFLVAVTANHFFILGFHQYHAFGLAGSSMAELAAQIAVTLFTLICIYFLTNFSYKNLIKHTSYFYNTWLRALRLGWPIALRWMNEMIAIAVIAIMIGYLGNNALAGFRVVSQLDILVLMIPYSMNIILALLLAKPQSIISFQKTFRVSISITLIIILLCSMAFWICPQWLLIHFFALDPHKPSLLLLSTHLLIITGIGQIFNALRLICNAALRALDDTFWPCIYSIISYWGIAVIGAWFFVMHEHHHMIALWWCLNSAYILASLLSGWRLMYHFR